MSADAKIILKGRGLLGGTVEGEALSTRKYFGFTHGVNPATGEIVDERHEWRGLNLKGKILVYPFGKSSSSGALWIIETVRQGNAPLAIINVEAEAITGGGCMLAEMLYGTTIVLIDKLDGDPCELVRSGDRVRANGQTGIVEILASGHQ
jgi:predicted aconitase with swiveling domain